jgi:hypothetical protein
MRKGKAVIATTDRLPNGHRFSREQLENIAETCRARLATDPYLNFNHRYDRPPVAKTTAAWVAEHPTNPNEWALYIEFETLADADPDEIARQLSTGAFSISFFGLGVSTPNAGEDQSEDLTIGLSPELGVGKHELVGVFKDAIGAFPEARISVRLFHQHAAEPASAAIVVFGIWLVEQVGGKIVDRLWSILFEREDSPARNAKLLKAHIRTSHGEVNVEIPVIPETAEMQKALADGIRHALLQHSGEQAPGRVAISYNDAMQPSTHLLPRSSDHLSE